MGNQTNSTGALEQHPVLRLELFGGPVLWRDHRAVRISPLQTGLLALAFSKPTTRIPRPALQRFLWKEDDNKVLRHRLSQLIYQTNQTVGIRIFEPQGEHICIRRKTLSCDVDDYSAQVRSGDFEKAWDILERGFLSACHHRRTPAFADWIEEQRIVRRSELRRAALAVWEDAEAAHDWSRAKRASEILLRLDPREETMLRRVMRARVLAGQVREAEAIYRVFAERIDPSGQWIPEPATKTLLQNVKDIHQGSVTGPESATNRSVTPPMVGREAELAQLTRSLFQRNPDPGWRTITVRGEAGVGKTRLVQEALRSAHFRGYRVMKASAALLERKIPLSPLLDALSEPWVLPFLRTLAEPWQTLMFTLVPELQDGSKRRLETSLSHPGEFSRQTCEAFLRLFTAIAESHRTILLVDGFHWMDDASIVVLQFLRRRWRRGELTLLVTCCEQELGIEDNVARFIHEEELHAETTTVQVRELDTVAALKLAESVAAVESENSQLAVIARVAGGNPRFLIDLAASSTGAARPSQLSADVPVPASVRRLMTRRLERLNDVERNVVCGLAVIERSTSLDRLRVITDSTRTECLDALDTLHRLRLVDWTPRGIGFRHAIFAQAVYQQIHPTRRSVLHARTAKVLYRASKNPALLEVARHYRLAGETRHASLCAREAIKHARSLDVPARLRVLEAAHDLSRAPHRGPIAARLSRACYELRRLNAALRFGRDALDGAAGLRPPESMDVRLAVADARHLLGIDDTESTLAELQQIEEWAHLAGDEIRVAGVVDTRVQLLDRAGMTKAVVVELERLRTMKLPAERAARCRILATLATQAEYGDAEAGLRSGRRAADLAKAGGLRDEAMLAGQRHTRALITCGLLATGEGWELMRAARALADETGSRGCQAFILLGLAEWHTFAGDHDIAATVLSEARDLTRKMDCPHVRALEHLARGNLAVARDDMEEGRSVLKVLQDVGTAGSDRNPALVPGRLIGPLAALEGNLLMELGKIHRVSQIAQQHPPPKSLGEAAPGLILFHTRLRSRTGDFAGAKDLLLSGLEANESRRALVWVRLALELVRLGRRTGDPHPDLARQARDRARTLGLAGLAHEFLPFCAQ